jgi:hypothetical protein
MRSARQCDAVPSVIGGANLFGPVNEVVIITRERERFHRDILAHAGPEPWGSHCTGAHSLAVHYIAL